MPPPDGLGPREEPLRETIRLHNSVDTFKAVSKSLTYPLWTRKGSSNYDLWGILEACCCALFRVPLGT